MFPCRMEAYNVHVKMYMGIFYMYIVHVHAYVPPEGNGMYKYVCKQKENKRQKKRKCNTKCIVVLIR